MLMFNLLSCLRQFGLQKFCSFHQKRQGEGVGWKRPIVLECPQCRQLGPLGWSNQPPLDYLDYLEADYNCKVAFHAVPHAW